MYVTKVIPSCAVVEHRNRAKLSALNMGELLGMVVGIEDDVDDVDDDEGEKSRKDIKMKIKFMEEIFFGIFHINRLTCMKSV